MRNGPRHTGGFKHTARLNAPKPKDNHNHKNMNIRQSVNGVDALNTKAYDIRSYGLLSNSSDKPLEVNDNVQISTISLKVNNSYDETIRSASTAIELNDQTSPNLVNVNEHPTPPEELLHSGDVFIPKKPLSFCP